MPISDLFDAVFGNITRAPEKKFPLFCQIGATRKAAKKWLNGQKSGPTDKKVDLNGQKNTQTEQKLSVGSMSVSPILVLVSSRHFFCRFSGGSEALFFRSPKYHPM